MAATPPAQCFEGGLLGSGRYLTLLKVQGSLDRRFGVQIGTIAINGILYRLILALAAPLAQAMEAIHLQAVVYRDEASHPLRRGPLLSRSRRLLRSSWP